MCDSSVSSTPSQAFQGEGFAWLCVSCLPWQDKSGQAGLITSFFSVSSCSQAEGSALSGQIHAGWRQPICILYIIHRLYLLTALEWYSDTFYTCREKPFPIWPLKMCPGLGHYCVRCQLPNCTSWPLMFSTLPSWPWLRVSLFPSSRGQNWWMLSKWLLGRTYRNGWCRCTERQITQRYGAFLILRNPSDWQPQTMEALGPLLILDDNATSALPNKVSVAFHVTVIQHMYVFLDLILKKWTFWFPLSSRGWKTLYISWSHICPMSQRPWRRKSLISPPQQNQIQPVKREVRNVLNKLFIKVHLLHVCKAATALTPSVSTTDSANVQIAELMHTVYLTG